MSGYSKRPAKINVGNKTVAFSEDQNSLEGLENKAEKKRKVVIYDKSPAKKKKTLQKSSKRVKKAKSASNKGKKTGLQVLFVKLTRNLRRIRINSRIMYTFAIIGIVCLLVFTGMKVFSGSDSPDAAFSDPADSGVLGENDPEENSVEPSFAAISPSAENEDVRSNYDPERGFYTFKEELAGKTITVNQQPIPANFVLSADVLLAQTEYSSIGRFETNKGTVYVARLESEEYHSVAFTFKELLVFITSSSAITDAEWAEYINSLE